MMGRPRKPLRAHMREGTYNATDHADRGAELAYEHGAPEPPGHLPPHGVELWKRIVANTPAGILSPADEKLFSLCVWYAHWRKANDALTEDFCRPNMLLASKSFEHFDKLASEFGLSPVARAKLSAPAAPKNDEVNPLVSLRAMRGAG